VTADASSVTAFRFRQPGPPPFSAGVSPMALIWRTASSRGVPPAEEAALMIRIQRAVMSCTQSMSPRYPERGYLMVNVTPECQIPTMIGVLGAVDR
jgi:hypothetical protein